MSRIRITSNGSGDNTRVYVDGVEMTAVLAVAINKIQPGKPVTATLTVLVSEIDIEIPRENVQITEATA